MGAGRSPQDCVGKADSSSKSDFPPGCVSGDGSPLFTLQQGHLLFCFTEEIRSWQSLN